MRRHLDTGYWAPFHCDVRVFHAAQIGIFICTNGPGFVANYPNPARTVSSIFDIIIGSNRSSADTLFDRGNDEKPSLEHQLIRGQKTTRVQTVLNRHQILKQIALNDVLGTYGHPFNGDLSIRWAPNSSNTTLQLYFSEWAHGRLYPMSESNTTFTIEWDSSIMDHFHSYPSPAPSFFIDFGVAETALFRAGDMELFDEYEFVRNATIDTFPQISWPPDSCGPERTNRKISQ